MNSFLYREAIGQGLKLSDRGALLAYSGEITGRCPLSKRIVESKDTAGIWWGEVNRPISQTLFDLYLSKAKLDINNNTKKNYRINGFAGWNRKYPVEVVSVEPYHALFMKNMLVPVGDNWETSREKKFTIYNLGCLDLPNLEDIPEFQNLTREDRDSIENESKNGALEKTLVGLDLTNRNMIIYGTRYAGEMKKGILTWMMYQMPLENKLCLHSSANRLPISDHSSCGDDNCTLFFGMSGTGKTTLSSDPDRILIGDDEHVWSDGGVTNIEGGCYAKCIGLSEKYERDIFNAVRYGSVLENVMTVGEYNIPDFDDDTITKNTRCSYPLSFIPNSACDGEFAGTGGHPSQIIFLACDAWGILPPISRLNTSDALYFFLSGYTSKMAGTELGVTEVEPTFSACFGEPFLVWHPNRYAEMLREKLEKFNTPVWLVNTGWTRDGNKRIPLSYTRQMVRFIQDGGGKQCQEFTSYKNVCKYFDFSIPQHSELQDIPSSILYPDKNWNSVKDYQESVKKLYDLFVDNFKSKL